MHHTGARYWLLIHILLWIDLVALLVGCVSAPPMTPLAVVGDVPQVEVGPLLEIQEGRTIEDSLHVVIDRDGAAHVLIASRMRSQTIEYVIRGDAIVEERVVQAGGKPSSVDATYDRQGQLHVLIGTDHYLFSEDHWEKTLDTTWDKAGIKVESARFVPGAPDLVWAFQVNGSDIGSPTRFEIRGGGGGYYALIWPWFTKGTRTVLVLDAGAEYGPWIVLEPHGKFDTRLADSGSDNRGNVTIIYKSQYSRGGVVTSLKSRYARIPGEVLQGIERTLVKNPDSPHGIPLLFPVEGSDLPDYFADMLAVDPKSGAAIMKMCPPPIEKKPCSSWFNTGAAWQSPVMLPITGHARAVPGGSNYFAAVVAGYPPVSLMKKDFLISFLQFEEGRWSEPVVLGLAHPGSSWNTWPFWEDVWRSISIARSFTGRTFIAWPTKDSFVGRWVHNPAP